MKTFMMAIVALVVAPFVTAAEISVDFSETFQEKLEDDYGLREGERLAEDLTESVQLALKRAGVEPARVELVIVNAKPNRPTFKQLGDRPGLDYGRSFGIGGAKVSGTVYSAAGDVVAEVESRWYETDIEWARYGGTWSDADRAFRMFARKLAKATEAATPGEVS